MTAEPLFTPLALRHLELPNRLVRSATYEGLGSAVGLPQPALGELYARLAAGGVGTIITGFAFVSAQGRAMHPGQCGLASDAAVPAWRAVLAAARGAAPGVKLIAQLAHTGRQTLRRVTGLPVGGASARRCSYFRQAVRPLDDAGLRQVIADFASAARRAAEAGFDGLQLHAAHGYLLHQFVSPWTNTRRDRWGERTRLLEEVIAAVRGACGEGFALLVKLSGGEDRPGGLQLEGVCAVARLLAELQIDAVEVSYGTMEWALNIMRGAVPVEETLRLNPLYNRYPRPAQWLWKRLCYPGYQRRLLPFREGYNREAALAVKAAAGLPVISVGGWRSLQAMQDAVTADGLDAVALCRPLICEPDLPRRLQAGETTRSRCCNCNLCTIHCDSTEPLRCYARR